MDDDRSTGNHSIDVRARVAVEVDRVADRLRGLSLVRLERGEPGGPTRAQAAREVAQLLADAAARLEAPPGEEPVLRRLPDLAVTAVADLVAVTGHDLVAVAGADAVEPLEGALDALVALRRRL